VTYAAAAPDGIAPAVAGAITAEFGLLAGVITAPAAAEPALLVLLGPPVLLMLLGPPVLLMLLGPPVLLMLLGPPVLLAHRLPLFAQSAPALPLLMLLPLPASVQSLPALPLPSGALALREPPD
jgi:hypothetical protein